MTAHDDFTSAKNSLENMTAVTRHYREDEEAWASLSNVEEIINYLTHWLETEDVEFEERQKMAGVILFLKGDKEGMPAAEKPHDRIPDDVQENLETLHGAMTIYTARLWADQQAELQPEDDNMFY